VLACGSDGSQAWPGLAVTARAMRQSAVGMDVDTATEGSTALVAVTKERLVTTQGGL
jgi:hypothetical protein